MDTALIVILVSSVFLIIGAILWQKGNHLLANGKIADGVIIANNFELSPSGGTYHPVVRFLTDKQEWITQELSIGYSTAKEEGTKVQVIYDPEDPASVEINSSFQLELLPRLFVVAGICGQIFGTLEYLDYIQMIPA